MISRKNSLDSIFSTIYRVETALGIKNGQTAKSLPKKSLFIRKRNLSVQHQESLFGKIAQLKCTTKKRNLSERNLTVHLVYLKHFSLTKFVHLYNIYYSKTKLVLSEVLRIVTSRMRS